MKHLDKPEFEKQFLIPLRLRGYKKEELGRLAESYGRYLNAERMANTEEKAEAFAEENPFWATVSTYPTALLDNVTGGVTAVGSTLGHTFGLSNYHSMDVNHPGYTLNAYTDLTRNAVSEDYNRTQQMAYNGLNQIADDTLERLAFLGIKLLPGSKKAAKTAGRIYDTVGAYGDVVRDAAVHGTDGNEAIFAGLPTAALHWLTSGINAEELVGTKTWEDWDKITQKYWENLAEMTQEELNQLGNVVIQTAILAEDSEFMQEVEALIKTGVSEKDARRIVYGQYFAEVENAIAWSYASGFLPIPN